MLWLQDWNTGAEEQEEVETHIFVSPQSLSSHGVPTHFLRFSNRKIPQGKLLKTRGNLSVCEINSVLCSKTWKIH